MSAPNINYGLIVILKEKLSSTFDFDDIEHFCGYEEEPDDWKEAKDELKKELIEDPEFELEHDIEEYAFAKATEDMIVGFRTMIESAE